MKRLYWHFFQQITIYKLKVEKRNIKAYLQFISTNNKAPAKRSQHAKATYRNIVGRNMLRAFGHRVATCWLLLAQVWNWSNLSQQHPTRRNMSQHVAPNNVATCCVGMLRSFRRDLTHSKAIYKLKVLIVLMITIIIIIIIIIMFYMAHASKPSSGTA